MIRQGRIERPRCLPRDALIRTISAFFALSTHYAFRMSHTAKTRDKHGFGPVCTALYRLCIVLLLLLIWHELGTIVDDMHEIIKSYFKPLPVPNYW